MANTGPPCKSSTQPELKLDALPRTDDDASTAAIPAALASSSAAAALPSPSETTLPAPASAAVATAGATASADAAEPDRSCGGLLGPLQVVLCSSPQPLCVVGPADQDDEDCEPPPAQGPADGGDSGSGAGGVRILEAANSGVSSRSSSSSVCSGGGGSRTCESSGASFAWAAYAVLPGAPSSVDTTSADESLLMTSLAPPPPPPPPASGDGDADCSRLAGAEVLYSNDALLQLCGYTRQQLRRGGLGMLLRPPAVAAGAGAGAAQGPAAAAAALQQQGLELVRSALASGSPSQLELACYHSSGRQLWCSVSLSPVVVDRPVGHHDERAREKSPPRAAAGCSGGDGAAAMGIWGSGGGGRDSAAEGGGGWRRHAGAELRPRGEPPAAATGCGAERCQGDGVVVHSAAGGCGDTAGRGPGSSVAVSGVWSGSSGCSTSRRSGGGGAGIGSDGMSGGAVVGGRQDGASGSIANNNSCECETGPTNSRQHQMPDGNLTGSRSFDRPTQQQHQWQGQEQQQQAGLDPYQVNRTQEPQVEELALLQQQQQQQRPVPQRCEEQQQQVEEEEGPSGAGTAVGAARACVRSDSHEWARRCQHEQRERLLRLRQLQLDEQRDLELEQLGREEQEGLRREEQQQQRQPSPSLGQQEGQQQQQQQAFSRDQQRQQQQRLRQQRCFLLIFNDVTAHKLLQQQLQHCLSPAQPHPYHQQQQQQLQQPQQQPPLQQQLQQQPLQQQQHGTEGRWMLSARNALANKPASPAPSPSPPLASALPAPSRASVPEPGPDRPSSSSPSSPSLSLVANLAADLAAGGCAACRLYDCALDALREGITIADPWAPDQPIVYTNRAFLAMTGYSREEVVGRNCRFLQGPDTDPAVVAAIREAIRRRQPLKVTLLNYTKSGERFWNELRLEPVVAPAVVTHGSADGGAEGGGGGGGGGGDGSGGGRLMAIIGVQNDVTELIARKQSEAALRDAKEAAESAAEAKSQFVANMSHEIRTPLNGMIATAQLLLGSVLTPEQRELAETILESGSTLLGVLGDILDFSKIDHGSLELQQRPMCLRQATEACLDLVAAEAAKKGLSLAYLVDDLALARPLLGDPVRIRQVLANLLSNAVKFTERGEVVVRVSVEQRIASTTSTTAATTTSTTAATTTTAATAAATTSTTAANTTTSIDSSSPTQQPDATAAGEGCWAAAPPPPAAKAATATATAAPDGGGDGDTDADDGSVVHIAVSDTGIGISEESARKLFQHFRQGTETMSRRYGGTGLGLAISKRLAQLMQGDVWVESRLGVGSTFHFTLRAQWASPETSPWPISPSPSVFSTPANSSDCTPRSSTDEGNGNSSSGPAAAAAAAALGLGMESSGGASRWPSSPGSGAAAGRLSGGSGGSSRGGRELRTSPWLPDGTPIDSGEGAAVGAEVGGGSAAAAAAIVPTSPVPPAAAAAAAGASTPPHRVSGSGSSYAVAAAEVAEERSALVGRTVLIDVSHAATSTQVWNSCRQLGLAAAQANACALPPLPPPPAAAALAAAEPPPSPSPSPLPPSPDLLDAAAAAAAAASPAGPRVGTVVPSYDILVVSMDRLVPALKAGWKGRPVVALGDRGLLQPALQPLVVALGVPVRHGRLATALVKATALLRWNGSSAPKLGNAPIPSESIQTLKSWRLKRGSDWDAFNRRTSLDNSALERTNVMLRGAAAAAAGAAAGDLGGGAAAAAAAAASAFAKSGLGLGSRQQHAPIPEHAGGAQGAAADPAGLSAA
ncbi:hypothetical protein PLESTM_000511500 [Pleodorina starrii]|nr:hypothetical protein PLESTM_000511500 [Pleodorina starrii]